LLPATAQPGGPLCCGLRARGAGADRDEGRRLLNASAVSSQSVDHVSTVLQATLKILARKHTQPQEVQPFIDALIEKTGPQPSGLEHVVAFYKNSDGPVLELARHVLAD